MRPTGLLQVALMMSAAFASLIAFKNGFTHRGDRRRRGGRCHDRGTAIFILLVRRRLIGTWNMAGTIPTLSSTGSTAQPERVFPGDGGGLRGSSDSPAFRGLRPARWASRRRDGQRARRVRVDRRRGRICGAYFGDKMTPLSETTIPRSPSWWAASPSQSRSAACSGRAAPALGIHLVIFLFIRISMEHVRESAPTRRSTRLRAPSTSRQWISFHWRCWLCSPATRRRCRHSWRSSGSALFRGNVGLLSRNGGRSKPFVAEPDLGPSRRAQGDLRRDGDRVRQRDRHPAIDELFSRGGDVEPAHDRVARARGARVRGDHGTRGFLERILQPIVARARREDG